MAATEWQNTILAELKARDLRESQFASIIANYRRLSEQAVMLKERNRNLLRAGTSNSGSNTESVKSAYIESLETQIRSLKEEIGTLYKTQGQNAQKLLTLTEQLREKDDKNRGTDEELRIVKAQKDRLERDKEDHIATVKEKERLVMLMQDEITTLTLEYNTLEQRNAALQEDNKGLLNRWLQRKNDEVRRMNDANQFLSEAEKKKAEADKRKASLTKTPTKSSTPPKSTSSSKSSTPPS